MADATQRTFIMVKPDGVQRGLVGNVIQRFEQRGYKLVALKLLQVRFKIWILKDIFFFLL
jgi:nucleoside-diphosphate kinase